MEASSSKCDLRQSRRHHGRQVLSLSPPALLNSECPHDRIRLYRIGDAISNEALLKKLQREYKRLSQLTQFIFWTSIGKEGILHFKEQLREKRMAEQLREFVASGLSVEKTQKIIRRSNEAQQKSNIKRSFKGRNGRSGRGPNRPNGRSGRGRGSRGGRRRGCGRGRGRGSQNSNSTPSSTGSGNTA